MPELRTWTVLGVAVAAAVAGLVRGFSGFGAGLIMAPSLIHLLGPERAVPLVILLDLAASVRLIPGALRVTSWRTILPMGIVACLMIPIGAHALGALQPDRLLSVVSGVVLLFVLLLAAGWRHRRHLSWPATAATGAASGLLTGLGGIGGPPVVLLLLSGPSRARENRAGFITYFGMTQVIALLFFASGGLITSEIVVWLMALLPIFLGAVHLGAGLFDGTRDRVYRRLALAFMGCVGLGGLILGMAGA